MCLKVCLKTEYNCQKDSLYCSIYFLIWLSNHVNMSMRFGDVTLHLLWHISSKVGVIIIKTNFFISVNNLFVLVQIYINLILNLFIQLIQFINYFICSLHFGNIISCIVYICIIQFCLQCLVFKSGHRD